MSKKRPAKPTPASPGPPGYYWWRYRCKLSPAYGAWQVVRWDGERVQVFGGRPWKLTWLFLQGGQWGPRIIPPGEGDTGTAFAIRPRRPRGHHLHRGWPRRSGSN